jgi:hypothetical protein
MFVILLSLCLCIEFRDLLEGEWTLSSQLAPSHSLYTIAFHPAGPNLHNVLNSTLWRDDLPSSIEFNLTEDPLIAQFQFVFSTPRDGKVISIFPESETLCNFKFTSIGSSLTTSTTIKGTPITVGFERQKFSITFGDSGPFEMKKVPKLSFSEPTAPWIETHPLFIGYAKIAIVLLLGQLVLWQFLKLCRSLIRRRRPRRVNKRKTE